ncbi:hypothetical protein J2Z76_001115 [Sedimentibacter acidaminivorans]|uniref:DUF1848 domain-containing protein n=1 Tax=Sedimentibacter acidaminivorans TaxID=913099 RepID=A0ABS4GC34_9FIRM|nr:DUF1848 domain-containing protein [Sedimentibacter acidaminivorans]MBP1925258.1 hypothetical protein [Sedimentibacter acidaminivorans]
MILSISRRSDIPAFYTDWLVNRFKEGYVLVRNPMNYHQVSEVKLSAELIDCIVFWTKDPQNIIPKLKVFSKYKYYFHITVNSYGKDIERNVRSKREIIKSIIELSNLIGRERIIWRYDPIILSDKYDLEYHEKYFRKLMEKLSPFCHKCVISFLDIYSKTKRNMKSIEYQEISEDGMKEVGKKLARVAAEFEMIIETCSEAIDLSVCGISHGKCIDDRLISKLNNCGLVIAKDMNQRDICGCVKSIDIGAYNTCNHKCLYCYANFSEKAMINNIGKHDSQSPFLIGNIEAGDVVKERKMEKYCTGYEQMKLYDL